MGPFVYGFVYFLVYWRRAEIGEVAVLVGIDLGGETVQGEVLDRVGDLAFGEGHGFGWLNGYIVTN